MPAFLGLLALVGLGVYRLEEALSFLVSPAVVTLFGAMAIGYVISESGAMELVGSAILSRVRSLPLVALLIYLAAGLMSAFVSDVAVMLAMSAMLSNAARKLKAPPAAYVIPLSFAVVLGGRITMVGTAANIILLGDYAANTGERLGIFAFTSKLLVSYLITAPLLVAAALLIQRFARGIAAPRKTLVMRATVGESLDGADKGEVERKFGVQILARARTLSKFSSVLIRGPIDELPALLSSKDLSVEPLGERKSDYVELLIVTPRSRLVGRSLYSEPIHELFPVSVIGLVPSGRVYSLETYEFRPGDEILVAGDEKAIGRLASAYGLARSKEQVKLFSPRLAASGVAGLAAAVALSELLPTALAFIVGALVALLGGGRPVERLYQAVSWDALIYVGSFIAIGRAAAELGLLSPLTPYLSSPAALFAVGLALSNTVGAVPAATLLGPLIAGKSALLALVASIMPLLLPFAHPAVYLAYRQSDMPLKDYLKASSLGLAAAAAAAYVALFLLRI
ncbi:MAG: SLC13 family permease [Thermoproteus sp.]